MLSFRVLVLSPQLLGWILKLHFHGLKTTEYYRCDLPGSRCSAGRSFLVPCSSLYNARYFCSLTICIENSVDRKAFKNHLVQYIKDEENMTPKVLRIVVLSMLSITLRHYTQKEYAL